MNVPAAEVASQANRSMAAELSSDQLDAMFVMGYALIQHRQTDKAMTLFESLQGLFPDHPHVLRSLSYVYLTARRYEDALALIEELPTEPDKVQSGAMSLLQSRVLWGLERTDEARGCLQDFIQKLEGGE